MPKECVRVYNIKGANSKLWIEQISTSCDVMSPLPFCNWAYVFCSIEHNGPIGRRVEHNHASFNIFAQFLFIVCGNFLITHPFYDIVYLYMLSFQIFVYLSISKTFHTPLLVLSTISKCIYIYFYIYVACGTMEGKSL